MSEGLQTVYQAVDDQHSHLSASTRRQLVTATTATLGGLGLLGLPGIAAAAAGGRKSASAAASDGNDPQTILNVAATAEVLATIVNTIGFRQVNFTDRFADVTKTNIQAAAREELAHHDVLVSAGVGGRELTKRIWIPDSVFANEENFLDTVIIGDQIFINAYMIGVTAFGQSGNGKLARVAAEFMGSEAVHRALARQSRGLLGNDRVFMKYNQPEEAPGPGQGMPGFTRITDAVGQLESKGFGFGKQGSVSPGRFYDYDAVSPLTPEGPLGLNTRGPDLAGPAPLPKPKAKKCPKPPRRRRRRHRRRRGR